MLKIKELFVVLLIPIIFSACGKVTDTISSLYQKQVKIYEEQINKQPKNQELRNRAGEFFYQFHDYSKTVEVIAGCADQKSKVLLAKTYAKLHEYGPALEIFEQVGEYPQSEYQYLYAQTLEEKNLYARAIKMYQLVKEEPLKSISQQRVAEIGLRIEEGVPENIKSLLKEERQFLSQIEKEEAVFLYVDETIDVASDNTSVSTVLAAKKVLKEKGKELAEVEIGYDSTDERVELEYARTITPQGEVIYVGAENIRDVTKYLNYPLYSNAKVFIISMPSVDVGAIIEYKVKIYSSKLICKNHFSYAYHLRERYPVARASFQVRVPKEQDVQFKFVNEEYCPEVKLVPEEKVDADKKVYQWNFSHIAPIIPEDKMAPFPEVNPAVLISSFKIWDEIYQWWHPLFKDKIKLDAKAKEFVAALIKDCNSEREKAAKISEFCARNIRYVGVEYGESGYEPHQAMQVLINKYGDCKDKTTLLVAMLRQAGLEAYPVLIPTRDIYNVYKDFPTVNFNHAIAAVVIDGDYIFMDATSVTTAFPDLPLGDQARTVLVCLDDDYKVIDTPVLENNKIRYQTNIVLDDKEGALVEREVTTSGFFAASHRYYLEYTHPQQVKETLREKMVEISPLSELIEYQVKNLSDFSLSPVLYYKFKAQTFLNLAGKLRIFSSLNDVAPEIGLITSKDRKYPVDFEGIYEKEALTTVSLPKHLSIQYLPKTEEINNKWFSFSTEYDVEKKMVRCYYKFKVKQREVEAKDYQEFKNGIEKVFYKLKEQIVLEES